MDRNTKILRMTPSVPRTAETFFSNFLHNSNYDSSSGLEVKLHDQVDMISSIPQIMEGSTTNVMSYGNQEKRIRRLTADQLESLEGSFQEERKLDPNRKMKLAGELGLQPRQVAVWFQNRRARWKAKKLEHLYGALKEEYDVVFREKQKLQDEVVRLKSMLKELSTKKQVSRGFTEASGDATESRTVAIRSSNNLPEAISSTEQNPQENYLFNVNDYNSISPSYWGGIPSAYS